MEPSELQGLSPGGRSSFVWRSSVCGTEASEGGSIFWKGSRNVTSSFLILVITLTLAAVVGLRQPASRTRPS